MHCLETKRAREEESAARRACGEEEKEVRREGVKEIEMERRRKERYGSQGKGGAALCESGLVERSVLESGDGGIEGTNHWRGREQKLERVGDIALVPELWRKYNKE